MGKKRKKFSGGGSLSEEQVELNVMPFVDIFSLLCTFLLFSAVFVAIGVLEVQIPFLSNATPETNEEEKRSISVNIEVEDSQIIVKTSYSLPPENNKSYTFAHNESGLSEFHSKLLDIKQTDSSADKVTLFVDDQITYERLVKVIDNIKFVSPGDGVSSGGDEADGSKQEFLMKKVVMGDVLL